MAALAAYDMGAAFRYNLEKDLFLMIETEGQCLKMNSASEVFENALINKQELSVMNDYDKLLGHRVLFVEASLDTIAPPDLMLKPLAKRLESENGDVQYESLKSNHSFINFCFVIPTVSMLLGLSIFPHLAR